VEKEKVPLGAAVADILRCAFPIWDGRKRNWFSIVVITQEITLIVSIKYYLGERLDQTQRPHIGRWSRYTISYCKAARNNDNMS
jgi:hypothetical protein